jgi:hypothetical protein
MNITIHDIILHQIMFGRSLACTAHLLLFLTLHKVQKISPIYVCVNLWSKYFIELYYRCCWCCGKEVVATNRRVIHLADKP